MGLISWKLPQQMTDILSTREVEENMTERLEALGLVETGILEVTNIVSP